MEVTGEGPPRAGRREWIGLAVLALPTLLLALDMSVLFIAIPQLSADLGATAVQQMWVSDVYGFLVAGFLVTMGTLGDRIGRRKLLLIGATAFGLASLAAAYAPTAEMLILARALLGVAGATLAPSTLALIRNMFADERERGAAIAVWVSCFMGGAAIGPVIGGMLLQFFWWGSVFLLAVPVMVLLLITAPMLLPEYRDPSAGRLDLVSSLLFLVAALPFVFGVKEVARNGFEPAAVAALIVSVTFGVLFVRRQRGLSTPLLDMRLFSNRAFTVALITLMFAVATQGGVMFLVSQQIQLVEGLSPIATGLWLMPGALAMITGSMLAPVMERRVHASALVTAGMTVSAAGYVVLSLVGTLGGLPLVVIGVAIVFFGVGPVAALTQNLVVGAVPPAKAGSAASISQTAGDLGIALGVAALGSIGGIVFRDRLAAAVDGTVGVLGDSIAGVTQAAKQLPPPLSGEYLQAARDAFTSGLNAIAIIAAVLAIAFGVLAARALRQVPSSAQASEPAEHTA